MISNQLSIGKTTPGPCIWEGMEFMNSKIPFLPANWTIARGGKYVLRFGLFVFVPGLHQMARKRWILGSLLFAGYFVSWFIILNRPFNVVDGIPFSVFPFIDLSEVVKLYSWLLLAIDVRKIDQRHLNIWFLLPVVLYVTVQFMPFHERDVLWIYIEQESYTCPAFCEHDIISFEFGGADYDKYSIGDYIIMSHNRGQNYVSRILVSQSREKEPCPDDYYNWIEPEKPDFLCPQGDKAAMYDFMIMGGHKPHYTMLDGQTYSLISRFQIHGYEPKKIGNLREYYFWSNDVTDWVGKALLEIYLWTRINFFGLTKIFL
jgi:hypothetical protein